MGKCFTWTPVYCALIMAGRTSSKVMKSADWNVLLWCPEIKRKHPLRCRLSGRERKEKLRKAPRFITHAGQRVCCRKSRAQALWSFFKCLPVIFFLTLFSCTAGRWRGWRRSLSTKKKTKEKTAATALKVLREVSAPGSVHYRNITFQFMESSIITFLGFAFISLG